MAQLANVQSIRKAQNQAQKNDIKSLYITLKVIFLIKSTIYKD